MEFGNTFHCRCKCRQTLRDLKNQNIRNENFTTYYMYNIISIIITLFNKLDNDIILEILLKYYKIGKPEWHYPINRKMILIDNIISKYEKGNSLYERVLNENITYENAELLFRLYMNCDCCQRHLTNRPECLKKPKINIELLFDRLENNKLSQ